MTDTQQCQSCGAVVRSRFLCTNCQHKLRNVCLELMEAWDDSVIALAKQSKFGSGDKTSLSSTGSPLPFDPVISEIRDDVKDTIRAWAEPLPGWARGPHPALQRFADSAFWNASSNRDAGQMLEEFEHCLARILKAVDRPQDRVVAGPCQLCGKELVAEQDAETALCRACDTVTNIRVRRKKRIQEALSMLADTDEILRVVPLVYGVKVTAKSLARWIAQRRLTVDGDGHMQIGRVIELAEELAVKRRRVS